MNHICIPASIHISKFTPSLTQTDYTGHPYNRLNKVQIKLFQTKQMPRTYRVVEIDTQTARND